MKPRLILIGVGASLAILILWYLALWSPQSKNLDKAKADRAVAEKNAADLNTQLTRLKKLELNKDVLERDKQRFAAAIPEKDQLDTFILAVNERATKAGVSFVSIAPQQPSAASAPAAPSDAPGAPVAIGLQMSTTGDYFQLLTFLELLRDADRIVTVENFSLSKAGDGKEMTASIGGRMYILPSVPTGTPITPASS